MSILKCWFVWDNHWKICTFNFELGWALLRLNDVGVDITADSNNWFHLRKLKTECQFQASLRSKIAATSIPGHDSGWGGHGFESHSQLFLLTYSGLIYCKLMTFYFLFSIYDTEASIPQQTGCLLVCFEWKSNYCAVHWCSLIGWCDTMHFKENIVFKKMMLFNEADSTPTWKLVW